MEAIYRHTDGAVTPNDFFALGALPASAAAEDSA